MQNPNDDKLFPYQKEGIKWLTPLKHALLADEMGLGKTVQAIKAADANSLTRLLIICPSVVRFKWENELNYWQGCKRKVEIMMKLSDRPSQDGDTTVICSFDYAAAGVKHLVSVKKWDALIIDEAHFLKNPSAKRTAAILGRAGLASASDRVWLLSGTPAPNHAGELWVFMRTFGVTMMSYDQFISRFCNVRKTEWGLQVNSSKAKTTPELRALLKTFMLRRLKKDVLKDLPKLSYHYIDVAAGKFNIREQSSFMQYFYPIDDSEDLKIRIKKEANIMYNLWNNFKTESESNLEAMASIGDSVSAVRRYIGLQKVEPVVDIIKRKFQHSDVKKIVVFGIHRDVLVTLKDQLKEFHPLMVFGGTSPVRRKRHIRKFQEYNKYKIFIGNITAAGTGIDLTAASEMIFIEQDWVPGNNAQAIMRCHRIGQENPVRVTFVGLVNSIDARVMRAVKRKTKELTDIFDD